MEVSKKSKIIATFLMFGAGLIGFYFIVKNPEPLVEPKKESIIQESIGKFNEVLAQNPIKWSEEANDQASGGENLTENLGKIIVEQVQAGNFSGADSITDFDIRKILQNKDLELNLISDIEDSKIKISQDNSKEAKIKYLNSVGDITRKELGDFKKGHLEIVIDVFQRVDMSSADRAAEIYKNIANGFLTVTTPKDFVDFHKFMIIHYKNSEAVYSALSEYKEDPLKGYLALEVIESVIKNSERAQELLVQKIKEMM